MADRGGARGGGFASRGDRGGDRGRGRGRGRGRRGGAKDSEKEWQPVTKLGRLVKAGKIKSMEEIYLHSLPIKEYQIVDFFLPKLKDEVMKIKPVQKQTRAGQRTRFKAIVIIGDSEGHVGLGIKTSKEVATAIRAAIIIAKLSVIPVRRGYWGTNLGLPHSLPVKESGKCGSVTVRLIPAPRGTQIVASPAVKRLLQLAGIEDAYTSSSGSTKTLENTLKATFAAISNTYGFLTPNLWTETKLIRSPLEEYADTLREASGAGQNAAAARLRLRKVVEAVMVGVVGSIPKPWEHRRQEVRVRVRLEYLLPPLQVCQLRQQRIGKSLQTTQLGGTGGVNHQQATCDLEETNRELEERSPAPEVLNLEQELNSEELEEPNQEPEGLISGRRRTTWSSASLGALAPAYNPAATTPRTTPPVGGGAAGARPISLGSTPSPTAPIPGPSANLPACVPGLDPNYPALGTTNSPSPCVPGLDPNRPGATTPGTNPPVDGGAADTRPGQPPTFNPAGVPPSSTSAPVDGGAAGPRPGQAPPTCTPGSTDPNSTRSGHSNPRSVHPRASDSRNDTSGRTDSSSTKLRRNYQLLSLQEVQPRQPLPSATAQQALIRLGTNPSGYTYPPGEWCRTGRRPLRRRLHSLRRPGGCPDADQASAVLHHMPDGRPQPSDALGPVYEEPPTAAAHGDDDAEALAVCGSAGESQTQLWTFKQEEGEWVYSRN
ncbi:hypothetical protein DL771_009329 [Monosporascus sp. 5C6A]|nr:hypothetical protein DL771_009329 [Monosporascus sp. 5C6A]